jgi:hypothetical protein
MIGLPFLWSFDHSGEDDRASEARTLIPESTVLLPA